MVALIPAILLESGEKVDQSLRHILKTLEYVTEEDGFYEDCSFIQHTNVPYTGSYGIVWLDGISNLIEFAAGTSYDLSNEPETKELYSIVENSFIPLIYKGGMMDMVRGRAIAKTDNDSHTGGHSVINCMIKLAQGAPELYRTKFLELSKYWLVEDKVNYHYKPIGNPYSIQITNALLNDEDISPAQTPLMSK